MCTINLILPILTFLFGFFVFWVYDRKIKIHTLKKFEDEKLEKKKAKIEGSFLERNSGYGYLVIKNVGKSTAYNVRFEFLLENISGINSENGDDQKYPCILTQNSSIKLLFSRTAKHRGQLIQIKFIWDDDFKKGNENIQSLQLW